MARRWSDSAQWPKVTVRAGAGKPHPERALQRPTLPADLLQPDPQIRTKRTVLLASPVIRRGARTADA